jgi:hypothetical protein
VIDYPELGNAQAIYKGREEIGEGRFLQSLIVKRIFKNLPKLCYSSRMEFGKKPCKHISKQFIFFFKKIFARRNPLKIL